MIQSDITIIGAGIVGLASAYALISKHPRIRILIAEKEEKPAFHQSGRNSGVIHSGIYYAPGSHKAKLCKKGISLLLQFADSNGIPYKRCGKLIVATRAEELPRMHQLYERGLANEVSCRLLSSEQAKEFEPAVKAVGAIWINDTGVIDYTEVANALVRDLKSKGVEFIFGEEFKGAVKNGPGLRCTFRQKENQANFLINCAGLHADRVASLSGFKPEIQIIPFRGEFFQLSEQASRLCNGLIYPVPDPNYPFLGVHVTRMLNGHVKCGPNAVLALAREGYTNSDFSLIESIEIAAWPGFRRFARKHWKTGAREVVRSLSRRVFLKSVQNLIPDIRLRDLEEYPSGVRAQAMTSAGKLLDDFYFEESREMLHVLNAPSPAATASFAIGEMIASRVEEKFK